ncbi:MAG: LPXTG cell wall anchor domain-containing protein [Erysipelotrichaceae bacterium]|jgi:LPXTG-motif cell wall-anchored protein|nr:LPXTG cell wall anchor domain-containing protein [Erysipelotrichaceae bacterium]
MKTLLYDLPSPTQEVTWWLQDNWYIIAIAVLVLAGAVVWILRKKK